jgi:alpha-glucoside transport system substrate-binding protein
MKKSIRVAAAIASAALAVSALGAAPASAAQKDDKSVVIYGAFGGDAAKNFQADLNAWASTNGIKVKYTSLNDFNTAITVKIKAGQGPDIAIWPQPGGLMAMKSKLKPLAQVVDVNSIKKTLLPGPWTSLAASGNNIYGLPIGVNFKSLVWYNPKAFKAAGYTVPKTGAQFDALVAKIKADGKYPCCATVPGWVASDWLEDMVLRYGGLNEYKKWAAGTTKFNSTLVKKAANKMGEYLKTEGNIEGGGKAAAATGVAWDASFDGPWRTGSSQCFMQKQGSFIQPFLPARIVKAIAADDTSEVDVFTLPKPSDAKYDGALGGGDLAAALNTNADTKKVMAYILSDKLGRAGWANSGFFYSAHKTFPSSLYPSTLQRKIGKLLAGSASFAFDQSDTVPPAVNDAESNWLPKWVAGGATLDEALKAIDAAWKK